VSDAVHCVAELEAVLVPPLQAAAEQLRREYPSFKFNVWSWSVGGATAYQGHDTGLECMLPDASNHEADCVAVVVGTKHLTTEPILVEASVVWGNGHHPEQGVELIETPVPLTPESLRAVASRLPELLAVFRNALQAWSLRNASA
jgi:hypothetical protein